MDNFLETEKNKQLSYRYIKGNKGVALLFMHGTLSDKNASKSLFIEDFCKKNGLGFLAFDFSGHGESYGKYIEATIGIWLQNALDIIDKVTSDKLLLVGSSMGGWIALLSALKRPERISGVVGLAAAADFTVDLWNSFSEVQKAEVNEKGILYIPNGWTEEGDPWTKELFEDAKKYLLLQDEKKIEITCPVTLIQGGKDDCVSMETPLKIMNGLKSDNVKVVLLKNSGHRLSEPEELSVLETELSSLLALS